MEGLLAVVGLEMTTESIRTGTGTDRGREFQIFGAATLKLCSSMLVAAVWRNK